MGRPGLYVCSIQDGIAFISVHSIVSFRNIFYPDMHLFALIKTELYQFFYHSVS